MKIVTEIEKMRSDLERMQQRIEARLAGGINEDDPVIARMIGRKVELERAIGVIEQLQAQLNAAKRGMDSAKNAGAKMMDIGKKLAAENSPEAIESEREANAVLTAENEQMHAEVERLQDQVVRLLKQNTKVEVLARSLEQERDQFKRLALQLRDAIDENDDLIPITIYAEHFREPMIHLTDRFRLAGEGDTNE